MYKEKAEGRWTEWIASKTCMHMLREKKYINSDGPGPELGGDLDDDVGLGQVDRRVAHLILVFGCWGLFLG
jgi:hypothetical protein